LGVIGEDAVPSVVEALLNSDNVTTRGSAAKVLAQIEINYPELRNGFDSGLSLI